MDRKEQEKLFRLLKEKQKRDLQVRLKANFYDFCVHMDSSFFTEGKPHLKDIAMALQGVADGHITKLAVSMPPRAGKSYITSLFCAWLLGKNPTGSIMRNSYAAKLAEKFSKDIRDGIMNNPKYLEIFPSVKASGPIDSWSLSTNTQPSYFCAGVGGAITGFGAKTCLPASELINTNHGKLSIEKLCQEYQEKNIKVLSYNHKSGIIRYNKILEARGLISNEIVEITTQSGRKLKCTADHRVWNGKEYIEAGLLQSGDKLYRPNVRILQERIQTTNVRTQEEIEDRTNVNLLFESVCEKRLFKKNKNNSLLSNLWNCRGVKECKILLNKVQTSGLKRVLCRESSQTNATNAKKAFRYSLPYLQQRIQAKTFRNNVLFKVLCRCGTLKRNIGDRKSKLPKFKCSVKNAHENGVSYKRQGQLEMLVMWFERRFGYSSFRRKSKKQYSKQLNNNMQTLSCYSSQITCDIVESIKRIYGETVVYDIQVDKDSNFFASDILVHNCAILDDPLKNIEEALSETTIETLWNWYTSTHLSRLESGCPEIHIATRWSKKDPIGRLTDEYGEAYCEDMQTIVISALDENGNSFCEEIKTTEEYHTIQKVTDEFIWEAEYMQHPIESKGLLYPVEELKRFTLEEIATKTSDGLIGFTDTADKGSDYLCSLIGKKFGEYTYVTDVIFTQDGVEITEPLVSQMLIDTKCNIMKIEANNGGESYARNVRNIIRKEKCTCQVIAEQATTNKETRILMASGYVKEYIYFRSDYAIGSDYDKFIRQVTGYVKLGKNKHDDGADCLTGLGNFAKTFNFQKKETPKHYNWDFERPEVDSFVGGDLDRSYIDYGGF